MPEGKMKLVRRNSVKDDFQQSSNPIPNIPTGGARIRVLYAGACYTDNELVRSGQSRPKMAGVKDTSLFPGYEVSGIVDGLCDTVANNNIAIGDRVIVYPDDTEQLDTGFAEYIVVRDVRNLVQVSASLKLEVAALLPTGALTAYSAVNKIRPFVLDKVNNQTECKTNILIVGAGGLGLWTLKLCHHFLGELGDKIAVTVADTDVEKLVLAKEEGCHDVIHWPESVHEEHLVARVQNVCCTGVDVVIDFVSSPRTIQRAMKVLNREGVLLVGGNTKYEVSFCLNSLAQKQQSIMGVTKGSRKQLKDLVDVFSTGQITPSKYHTFPVEEANSVFEQLSNCKLMGRAVLKVSADDILERKEEEEEDFNVNTR